ncbi:hypothetical protein FXO38_11998 [Capsicum annuum]|nr:hypothetical protein FXO38_11998 [Capsicum annuum]
MNPNYVPPEQGGAGVHLVQRNSFIEISSFKNATHMIFPENEDKTYVHLCPVALTKSSFDLRPSINSALAKYVVVMTPALRNNHIPLVEQSTPNPTYYTPMSEPTSFIV